MTFDSISPFSGYPFWAITFIFILFIALVSSKFDRPLIRNIVMIVTSLIIVGSVVGIHLFLLLILVSVLNYWCGVTILNGTIERNRKIYLWACIGLVTFFLCFFKYAIFQNWVTTFWQAVLSNFRSSSGPNAQLFFIGVSYFCFKFIHFQFECHNHKIKTPDLLTFINYTIFFPSFFSGPINRYEAFSTDIHNGDNGGFGQNIIPASKRIINGLFKKIVLANSLFPYTIATMNFSDPSVDASQAVIGVYAYMFFIYFDFSGYTDMALGVARLVGIKLPENFNYPFLKRNLQQFWANWHMSLTNWLTDYIYWPLARKVRHVERLKAKPVTISNICIIATFTVCGMWHGDGLNFLLWGIYHGVGLAVLNIYTSIEKKYFSMQWRKLINKSRIGYAASCLVTFQYVAFGFFLFGCDLTKQEQFFNLVVKTYIK